jgi:hypothetical protein
MQQHVDLKLHYENTLPSNHNETPYLFNLTIGFSSDVDGDVECTLSNIAIMTDAVPVL